MTRSFDLNNYTDIKKGQLYDRGLNLAGLNDKFDLVFSHAC